jgi:hypothetical protein
MENKVELFIQKSIIIHGDKYHYIKVNYTKAHQNVIIICKEHGEFKQTVVNHLKGGGCKLCCLKEYENIKIKFGDNYLYNYVNYINNETKIQLKCTKCLNFVYVKPKDNIIHNCIPKELECGNCYFMFRAKNNESIKFKYIYHQTYCCNNIYKKLKCNLCEKYFETQKKYENHFDTLYHNENLKKFIYLQEKEAQQNERYLMYEEEFNSIDIKNFQIDKKELIIKKGIYSGKSIEDMDDGYKKFIYKEKFKYQNFHIRVYLKNYFLTKNQSNAFLP